MADSPVEVKTKGLNEAVVDLTQMGERGSDIRRCSEQVRTIYRESTERRFSTEGLGRWAPLSPERAARKGGGELLVDTGALRRSLTAKRASQQVDVRRPTMLLFGSSVDYGHWLDVGTKPPRHTPARRLIKITPAERKRIKGVISTFVAKGTAVGQGLKL